MGTILVIGSTILDVIGTYDEQGDSSSNKLGRTSFSVGGVGFNIAANLAANKNKVSLFTYLSNSSLGSQIIHLILKGTPINREYVFNTEIQGDTYLAHYCGRHLKTGITNSTIEHVALNIKKLNEAIIKAEVIAIDTNLSFVQISQVLECCKNHPNKKLLALIVAAPRAKNIYKREFSRKFDLVGMNEEEAATLNFSIAKPTEKQKIALFCHEMNAKSVVVTKNDLSYIILNENGSSSSYDGWEVAGAINDLGAKDALFSAICASAVHMDNYESNETNARIREWVSRVMQRQHSNLLDSTLIPKKTFWGEKKERSIWLISLIAVSLFCVLVGTFYASITPILFWLCFFLCSASTGAIGGILKLVGILDSQWKENGWTLYESMMFGALAGLVTSFLFIGPHLTIKDEMERSRTSVDGLSILIIWIFPISLGAGLTLETVLNSLRNKAHYQLKEGSIPHENDNPVGGSKHPI